MSDWRVASAASAGRPSPILRLTIAIVPIASDRHTGNMRNRKLPAAPTPAVAVAPRWPTNAKMIAVPAAVSDCSMMLGHASSIAARAGESFASCAARALGVGAASSSTSSAVWIVTARTRRGPRCGSSRLYRHSAALSDLADARCDDGVCAHRRIPRRGVLRRHADEETARGLRIERERLQRGVHDLEARPAIRGVEAHAAVREEVSLVALEAAEAHSARGVLARAG